MTITQRLPPACGSTIRPKRPPDTTSGFSGARGSSPSRDTARRGSSWLKDRYGLSWQVVPDGMDEMLRDGKSAEAQRAMMAMLKMKKIDIAELRRAFAGGGGS